VKKSIKPLSTVIYFQAPLVETSMFKIVMKPKLYKLRSHNYLIIQVLMKIIRREISNIIA